MKNTEVYNFLEDGRKREWKKVRKKGREIKQGKVERGEGNFMLEKKEREEGGKIEVCERNGGREGRKVEG